MIAEQYNEKYKNLSKDITNDILHKLKLLPEGSYEFTDQCSTLNDPDDSFISISTYGDEVMITLESKYGDQYNLDDLKLFEVPDLIYILSTVEEHLNKKQ